MTERSKRGRYGGVYVALLDEREWRQLSPQARLSLLTLKITTGPSGIDVVHPAVAAEHVGISPAEVFLSWAELQERGWIRVVRLPESQRCLVWVVNGLKHEPSFSLVHEKHRKGIIGHLGGLPSLALVNEFADHYGLGQIFESPEPGEPLAVDTVDNQASAEGPERVSKGFRMAIRPEYRDPSTEYRDPNTDLPKATDQGAPLSRTPNPNGACSVPPPGFEHDERWPATHGFYHKAWNGRESGFLKSEILEYGIEPAYAVARDLERDKKLLAKPIDERKRIIQAELSREHGVRGGGA